MSRAAPFAVAALLALTPTLAAAADPTAFASAADIDRAVADMAASLKPGQHFLYHPLLKDGVSTVALEYWTAPGPPAVHPAQAEYVVVVAGAGTMISGGQLAGAHTTNPDLVEGSGIVGGVTRKLVPGDAFLVPAGVPHWFDVTGGRLVLLGTKQPRPAAAAKP